MVNVFGNSTGEGGLGNLQVLRKAISGKYVDYIDEIQASRKLGYPAYRIAPEGTPTFVFTYPVLARTTNPRGILMLNLSVVKGMKSQTYRKRLVMVIFQR